MHQIIHNRTLFKILILTLFTEFSWFLSSALLTVRCRNLNTIETIIRVHYCSSMKREGGNSIFSLLKVGNMFVPDEKQVSAVRLVQCEVSVNNMNSLAPIQ